MAFSLNRVLTPVGRAPATMVLRQHTRTVTAKANGVAVQLSSSGRSDMNVAAHPKGNLAAYVKDSPAFFGALEMPMGGSLRAVDVDNGVFELTVPRIQMFDLWIQPRAVAIIRVESLPCGASRLAVTANECKLTGSKHVEQFKLNERFALDVNIKFKSDQPNGTGTAGALRSEGVIGVKVDIPPPFSFMPKSVLQSTGNVALNSTVSILLGTLMGAMVKDYARWCQQQMPVAAPPATPAATHAAHPHDGMYSGAHTAHMGTHAVQAPHSAVHAAPTGPRVAHAGSRVATAVAATK